MAPKITVFMAAYNAADYISESIDSILGQSFKDFELLIVNDGSTDQTEAIVRTFEDPRIRFLQNETNKGIAFTRNIALREAKGSYIAVLDSDDVAVQNRLELQYNYLTAHPDIALCGGHGRLIDHSGKTIDDNNRLKVPTDPQQIKMILLFLNAYVNSTVMYRATVFRELGGYQDYAPAEDYDLFIRISDRFKVANLDETLVNYRDHNQNTSRLQTKISYQKITEIKKAQLRQLGLPDDPSLVRTMMGILNWDFSKATFAEYAFLLSSLKSANQQIKKYPAADFERMLFNYWFEIIYNKKAKMNAISLLLNPSLFKLSLATPKQLRKVLKLSLRGLGSISK